MLSRPTIQRSIIAHSRRVASQHFCHKSDYHRLPLHHLPRHARYAVYVSGALFDQDYDTSDDGSSAKRKPGTMPLPSFMTKTAPGDASRANSRSEGSRWGSNVSIVDTSGIDTAAVKRSKLLLQFTHEPHMSQLDPISLSCGSMHCLFVDRRAGQLYGVGENRKGQCGVGGLNVSLREGAEEPPTMFNRPHLVDVYTGSESKQEGAVSFSSVHCGKDFSIAVTADRKKIYSSGSNDSGQLGIDPKIVPLHSNLYIMYPIDERDLDLNDDEHIEQVTCGGMHCLILTSENRVLCFGNGTFGQLVLGSLFNEPFPVDATEIIKKQIHPNDPHSVHISQIAAGMAHTLVLTSHGEVYAVGRGIEGQLGLDTKQAMTLQMIQGFNERVTKISCGFSHSVALCDSGNVYTWGRGLEGAIAWGGVSVVGRTQVQEKQHALRLVDLPIMHTDKKIADIDIESGAFHSLILITYEDGSREMFGIGQNGDGQLSDTTRRSPNHVIDSTVEHIPSTRVVLPSDSSDFQTMACGFSFSVLR